MNMPVHAGIYQNLQSVHACVFLFPFSLLQKQEEVLKGPAHPASSEVGI
jgi:hypothetical protein